jgi:ParB family chromosome partitioning protein
VRWIDGDLVDQLANEALAAAAESIREREGFAEIRVLPTTHVVFQETYDLQPMHGELPPLAAEQEARCDAIQTELEAIEQRSADPAGEGSTEEDEARVRDLEAEYQTILDRTPILTDEQKASALAYVVIGRDGQPRIHEQLYVAPSTSEALDPEIADVADEQDALDHQDPGRPAISQRLADELATMKAELLRLHVASDPRFALDLGTFYMADKAAQYGSGADLATELRSDEAPARIAGFRSDTQAAQQWAKLDASLDRSWADHADVNDRFDAFCALPDDERAAWLGWAIARTIHSVPAGKTGSSFIDHIGQKLEIDVASWWRPTATNYFDRISKGSILAQFEEVGGIELRQRYGASKKHDLAASAETLFAGNMHLTADEKEKALAWVPDAMRFKAPQHQPANDREITDARGSDEATPAAGSENSAPFADAA